MKKVEVVYRHPNPQVMASGPRILDFTPAGKPMEYYEPEDKEITVGDNKPVMAVVYTVPPEYARRILSSQPERYFLLTPEKLIVPKLSQNGMRRDNLIVHSILSPAKNPEPEAKPEPEPDKVIPADDPPKPYDHGHPLRQEANPNAEDTPDADPGDNTEPTPDPVDPTPAEPVNPLDRPSVGEE